MNNISWTAASSIDALSHMVSTFIADDTKFIAYCIRGKENILSLDKKKLTGRYESLKNNNGIYFLIGESDDKTNVYVGQAVGREHCCGADRLKEHAKNTGERYYKDWDASLFITKDDNSFDTGVIDTLEKSFIELFNALGKRFKCLNNKVGTSGNVPVERYTNAFNAIVGLLNSPMFGFCIGEADKAPIVTEGIAGVLNRHNTAVEKIQNNSENKSDAELWIEKANYYTQFKEDVANSSGYVFGNRIHTAEEIVKGIRCSSVITPPNISESMVNMLPNEVFNSKSKFIDLYSKSGIFICKLIDKFMSGDTSLPINSESEYVGNPRAKLDNLINNQLYCITNSLEINAYVYRNIIDHIEMWVDKILGHTARVNECNINIPRIACINNFDRFIKDYSIKFDNELKHNVISRVLSELGINTGEGRDTMKFDVVIGNPPYNNDLYIDFVTLGHELSKEYCCMITPAKWQAKGGGKNEEFRAKIVPHIEEIVYYPNEKEVFNISAHGGICYYSIGRESTKTSVIVHNVNRDVSLVETISHTTFNENIMLDINARKIVDKVMSSKFTGINESLDCPKFSYFCGKMACEVTEDTTGTYYLRDNSNYFKINDAYVRKEAGIDEYKVYHNKFIDNSTICHIYNHNEVASRNWCLLGYGDKAKCESIKSYYECRLIWYLVVASETGSTTNKEAWRFVPDPGNFDHIFTDEELYKRYNLTPDEINIIESVIKERK